MNLIVDSTASEALSVLEGKKGAIDFLGYKVEARVLGERLREAIGLVEGKLGGLFGKLELDRIVFEQLPGAMVGEALSDGKIKIDPVMLLHPVSRLTMVLAHELLHAKKDVMSDELVDAMVEIFFPNGMKGSSYDREKMKNFAKTAKLNIVDLWKMYRDGNFRGIYLAYAKGINDDKDKALDVMKEMFPELTFTEKPEKGWTTEEPRLKGAAGLVQAINNKVLKVQ